MYTRQHWSSMFCRRSIVIAKSIDNLNKLTALFAGFNVKVSINELFRRDCTEFYINLYVPDLHNILNCLYPED